MATLYVLILFLGFEDNAPVHMGNIDGFTSYKDCNDAGQYWYKQSLKSKAQLYSCVETKGRVKQ